MQNIIRKFRVDQHLIVVNLNNILINEILVTEFMTESFTESKFDASSNLPFSSVKLL